MSDSGCRGKLLGKAVGESCWGKLLGKAVGESCLGKLFGKAVGESCWGKLLGKAVRVMGIWLYVYVLSDSGSVSASV